ncbi:MAG: 6-bladed beta-propeller [candidate division KSB1 bacterium]|nr:6-bladed beta-propeller [candidate division KSB1 bacterium]
MRKSSYNKRIIIFFFLYVFSCTQEKHNEAENANSYNFHVNYLKDFFVCDTILLNIPNFVELNHVKSACILYDQRLLLAETKSSQLFLFDSTGNFISTLGMKGQGPEEFFRPWHIAANRQHIVIGDFHNRRISVFDSDLNFLQSFQVSHMIHDLILTEGDTLIIHDHETARLLNKESIYVYSVKGELKCKLGGPFELGYKLRHIPFRPQGPLLTKLGKFLFEMDYPDYKIKKYALNECKFLKILSHKPSGWKSLLDFNYQKLKPPKVVDQATLKKLDTFFNDLLQTRKVYWFNGLQVLSQDI